MQFLKATGVVGTILALLVVVIAFFKQLIAFVGFLMFAIKAVIVLGFVALFVGIGLIVLRSWNNNRRQKENGSLLQFWLVTRLRTVRFDYNNITLGVFSK